VLRPVRSRERTAITMMMASASVDGTCSLMSLTTTRENSMIHLPIGAEKSTEAAPVIRGWRARVFARVTRKGSIRLNRCIRVPMKHSLLDFTELSRSSPVATESWMMVNPSDDGRIVQRCTNGMETSGAYRKRRAFGFPVLPVGPMLAPASKRVVTWLKTGVAAQAASQLQHGKTAR